MKEKNIIELFKESLKNKNTYIPNLLTASRLIGAFVVPGLFLTGNIPGSIIAAAAFGATDFFDGKIARATNGYSEFGKVLDPIVDKAFAVISALAILPSMPILALNIGAEAAIGYINSKSYMNNGKPESSFLGKFKTFCLFPTIGLGYLATAVNMPAISLLANIACLGTLGVQTLATKDYYTKAKEQNKEKPTTILKEENLEKEQIKVLEDKVNYEKTKEKNLLPSQNQEIETMNLEHIILENIPELIEAPVEQVQDKPKTLIKENKNKRNF